MTGRTLTADLLVERAQEQAKLDDWGDPPFREALDQLCASFVAEYGANVAQAGAFEVQLLALLTKRVRLYADRTAFPEIAAQEIRAPIFVTGFPRSGTTILHALLAADPRARSPLAWELAEPSPPPRADTFGSDPRIARQQAIIEQLPAQFRAMHAMGAELPDECNAIMQLAFQSLNFTARQPLPSYQRWLLDSDMRPAFGIHNHMLQHLQAFAPRDWWVLKSPPHLFHLDALFDAYPDARIVFIHRDPAAIMPSNASLIAFLHEMAGNAVDKLELGKAETAKWRLGMDRAMAFRDAHPQLAGRFIDILYADFVDDPIGAVLSIYEHYGIPETREARRSMEGFMAANRQGKHGKHHYSAEEFGMRTEEIHEEFADYLAHFSLPVTGGKT
jgi:sulfotransferase family protein